jgi:hypothetical protein
LNIKTKITAGLAATALALGMGLAAAAPANACYGNSVWNNSYGLVSVQKDNGQYVNLWSRFAKTYDVKWVQVPAYATVSIGLTRYYGYEFGYWVKIGCGQYTVNRIS